MSRYEKTAKNGTKDGLKLKYTTTLYKKVEEKDDDMFFISQHGDRCDNLAYRFYGNPELWWFIARVNNLKTMNIPAGTSLRIPVSIIDAEGF